ncbi:MAG: IclR family transcriptional regulator [Actinomyces sp.]|nr:IclR family transcriptional regulator [Actinomyces sp.]MCI1831317.1 IclR family transcriptional regulator [Actinomyces sp.]
MSEQQMHQSVARAAAILDAIGASAGPGMRAAEIAEAAGLGLSTTTRLLATLLELGFASRVSEREYALGPRLLALSSQELNQSAVFRESRMLCQSLAQSTRLNANVAVRHGARCVYLCHFEGDLSPKNQSMVGLAMPLHATGLGKCLLLDTSEQERIDLLGAGLPVYTPHTVSSHAELTRQLEEGRERGYCVEDQELALGRFCLASPVRDRTGGICAAVSVSGRISVFTGDQRSSIQEQLVESADRISVNLGHLSGASAG